MHRVCNIIKYKMELLFRLSTSSSHAWKYIHQYNIIPEQTVFQTIRNTLSVFTIVNSRTISISDKNIVKSLINLKKKRKSVLYMYMCTWQYPALSRIFISQLMRKNEIKKVTFHDGYRYIQSLYYYYYYYFTFFKFIVLDQCLISWYMIRILLKFYKITRYLIFINIINDRIKILISKF